MWDLLIRIVAGLQPEPNADPLKQYYWDRRVGLTLAGVFVMTLGLSVAVAAGFGLVSFIHPGFLKADDMTKVTQTIQQQVASVHQEVATASADDKRRWAIQLSNALPDVRYKHCHAKTSEGKRLYWDQISNMMNTYTELTGKAYNLPACEDL